MCVNDPHVEAVHYFIQHDDLVDYSDVSPLDLEDDMFHIHAENGQVSFKPKNHYATEEDAKSATEDFVRRWEFVAALSQRSSRFQLAYAGADIVDRNPSPPQEGVSEISVAMRIGPITMKAQLTEVVADYPTLPSGLPLNPDDPDALYMAARLDLYRRKREPLGSAAYVCLTVLEESAAPGVRNRESRRVQTASHFRIAKDVLDQVGDLSSEKGGELARKADGRKDEFTKEETLFLEASLMAFVRRVAEKAADPTGNLPEITAAALPGLSG